MRQAGRHSSEYEHPGHHHFGCDEHSTLRRWCEAGQHTEIVSGVGDPDRDTVGTLIQHGLYLDAIHRCAVEAEPEGPPPLGSVGRDAPAGDGRAPNGCTAGVDPLELWLVARTSSVFIDELLIGKCGLRVVIPPPQ
jgi:hypothetical protein